MLCEVVGTSRVDFTDDSGRAVSGYSVHVTHEDVDGRVIGLVAEQCSFLTDERIRNNLGGYVPSKGDIINAEFNKRGKLVVMGAAS